MDRRRSFFFRGIFAALCLVVLPAGCGGAGCPAGQHQDGGRCVCDQGVLVNDQCVAPEGDGDPDQEPDLLPEEETDADLPDQESPVEDAPDQDSDQNDPAFDTYQAPEGDVLFSASGVMTVKTAGSLVVVAANYRSAVGRYDIYALPARGGDSLFLGNVSWDLAAYDWLDFLLPSGGDTVVYSNYLNQFDVLYRKPLDGGDELPVYLPVYAGHWTVSPDGQWVAFGRGNPYNGNGLVQSLFLRRTDLESAEVRVAGNVVADSFTFTPDSSRIVYGVAAEGSYTLATLYAYSLNGGFVELVGERCGHPHFVVSPDSGGVLFHRRMGSGNDIFALMAARFGGGDPQVLELVSWPGNDYLPTDLQQGPYSNYLVFGEPLSNGGRRWRRISVDGGQAETLTDITSATAKLDPTGRFLLVWDQSTLTVVTVASRSVLASFAPVPSEAVAFSPDGRYVYFPAGLPPAHPQAGETFLAALDFSTGICRLVAGGPDGRTLAVDSAGTTLFFSDQAGALVRAAVTVGQEFP